MLGPGGGLRVLDREKDWSEAFRDNQYGDRSHGAAFSHDGRLATASFDGLIRLYQYDPGSEHPNFHRFGEPVKAPSEVRSASLTVRPANAWRSATITSRPSISWMAGL